jgi:hypothetical protein
MHCRILFNVIIMTFFYSIKKVMGNRNDRLLITTSSFKPSQAPSINHNKFVSRAPSHPGPKQQSNENARHNQVVATRILVFFVLSITYMICLITIIQRRRRKRREEAQRISMTAHPSRPLHPMSQEAVVI